MIPSKTFYLQQSVAFFFFFFFLLISPSDAVCQRTSFPNKSYETCQSNRRQNRQENCPYTYQITGNQNFVFTGKKKKNQKLTQKILFRFPTVYHLFYFSLFFFLNFCAQKIQTNLEFVGRRRNSISLISSSSRRRITCTLRDRMLRERQTQAKREIKMEIVFVKPSLTSRAISAAPRSVKKSKQTLDFSDSP